MLVGVGGSAAERSFMPTATSPAGLGPGEALPNSLGSNVSMGHINSCTLWVFSALRTVPDQVLTDCLSVLDMEQRVSLLQRHIPFAQCGSGLRALAKPVTSGCLKPKAQAQPQLPTLTGRTQAGMQAGQDTASGFACCHRKPC